MIWSRTLLVPVHTYSLLISRISSQGGESPYFTPQNTHSMSHLNEYTCRLVYKRTRGIGIPSETEQRQVFKDATKYLATVPAGLLIRDACIAEITQRPVPLGNTLQIHEDWVYVYRDNKRIGALRLKFLQARWYVDIGRHVPSSKQNHGQIDILVVRYQLSKGPKYKDLSEIPLDPDLLSVSDRSSTLLKAKFVYYTVREYPSILRLSESPLTNFKTLSCFSNSHAVWKRCDQVL